MKQKLVRIAVLILGVGAWVLGPLALSWVPAAHAVGGSYTLNWSAADPTVNKGPYLPSYTKVPPAALACPAPSGSSGRASDPMPNAIYAAPGGAVDSVNSLTPSDMALGQIVPFEMLVTVGGSTAPENGAIQFTMGFSTQTTSNNAFGFDPAYAVYCAFVDAADAGTMDPGGNAKVDSWTASLVGTEIQGVFNLSGLDNGDKVVVEIWVALDPTWPTGGATGNVQTSAISAQTMPPAPYSPQAIKVGNQTVPLLQVGQFESACVDLSVVKADGDQQVQAGEELEYTLTISKANSAVVANTVVVIDTLDPWLKYVSLTSIFDPNNLGRTCTYSGANPNNGGGQLSCNLKSISAAETVTVVFRAQVLPTIPAYPSAVETGTCTQNNSTWDLCNLVSVSSLNCDSVTANNSDSEPKDVIAPTAVDLKWFRARGTVSTIKLGWETASEIDNLGFNVYRAERVNGPRTRLNLSLIPTQVPPGSPFGATYTYRDATAQPGVAYYYWLEDVDIYGGTGMHGPVKARLAVR